MLHHGGNVCHVLRTAACAAVAARYLLASPPKSLGLVGCGGLGLWSLRFMGTVFPSIERVMVSSRSPESRVSFCAERSAEGPWKLIPVDHPDEAVRDVDLVVSSIPPSEAKPVRGDVLGLQTLFIPLDLINSWDDAVMERAERVVADNPSHFSARVQSGRSRSYPALDSIERIQDLGLGPSDKIKTWQAHSGCRLRHCQYRFDARLGPLSTSAAGGRWSRV